MEALPVKLDHQQELELWRRTSTGDPKARAHLIEHYMPFARMIAAKLYRLRPDEAVEFADYLQYAHIGLIDAVDRYRPGLGAAFGTYAAHRVRGAVLNGVGKATERREQYAWRRRLQQERIDSLTQSDQQEHAGDLFTELLNVGVGLALGYMLEDTAMFAKPDGVSEHGPYRSEEMAALKRRVHEAVDDLPEREALIIRYHYFHQVSLQELGGILELSTGRISQLHKRALERVREALTGGEGLDQSI